MYIGYIGYNKHYLHIAIGASARKIYAVSRHPTIIVYKPTIMVLVSVKNKRKAFAGERLVEVSYATRRKNKPIPRPQTKQKSSLKETQFAPNPITKRNDHAEILVAGVPVSVGGDCNVDNEASERMSQAPFVQGEAGDSNPDVFVLFWK